MYAISGERATGSFRHLVLFGHEEEMGCQVRRVGYRGLITANRHGCHGRYSQPSWSDDRDVPKGLRDRTVNFVTSGQTPILTTIDRDGLSFHIGGMATFRVVSSFSRRTTHVLLHGDAAAAVAVLNVIGSGSRETVGGRPVSVRCAVGWVADRSRRRDGNDAGPTVQLVGLADGNDAGPTVPEAVPTSLAAAVRASPINPVLVATRGMDWHRTAGCPVHRGGTVVGPLAGGWARRMAGVGLQQAPAPPRRHAHNSAAGATSTAAGGGIAFVDTNGEPFSPPPAPPPATGTPPALDADPGVAGEGGGVLDAMLDSATAATADFQDGLIWVHELSGLPW